MQRIHIFMLMIPLMSSSDAYAMDKPKEKLVNAKMHHSDEGRSLRKAWMCECETCTEQLRAEGAAHERMVKQLALEGPALALTPEQVAQFAHEREIKRIERVWQLRQLGERQTADRPQPQRRQREWDITIGAVEPRPRIVVHTDRANPALKRFLTEFDKPEKEPGRREELSYYKPEFKFSDEEDF